MSKTVKIITAMIIFLTVGIGAWFGYTNSEYYVPVQTEENTDKVKDFRQDIGGTVTDPENLLNNEQVRLLTNYAVNYGRTLARLEPVDISVLFSDTSSKNYWQNVAAYNVLTSIRKMSFNDLQPEKVLINYNVQRVESNGNRITVHITEDNVQKFKHLSRPSESYNINHIFVLEKTGDNWLVKSHEQEEDFFLLAQQAWDNAGGADNSQKAENTLQILIADAQENIDELKISTGDAPMDIKVTDTSYDRDAAVAYAKELCNKRNYNGRWLAYDMYGGNCQNFASQCIYAGGIKMDNRGYGESQWKFYSQTLNNKQTASGRSYSWTGVDPFYTYATINRSNGLICQADLALNYAEKGDVIQVGAYYEWRHSLVVTDVLFDADGSLQDIIVASNTADRWNYPLSAYIYTYPRLIHILGQI